MLFSGPGGGGRGGGVAQSKSTWLTAAAAVRKARGRVLGGRLFCKQIKD